MAKICLSPKNYRNDPTGLFLTQASFAGIHPNVVVQKVVAVA
jgi:hypothetical protein